MTININKYVNVVSGVGGGSEIPNRSLVARMFTGSTLLYPGTFAQFTSAADVGIYFGTSSEEYARALFYFSWVSKSQAQPQAIQYARWVVSSAAPQVYSAYQNNSVLSSWTTINNGAFVLNIASTAHTISGLDFTGASDLPGVAAIIQTAVRLISGTMYTAATVTYASNTGFVFTGGQDVAATIVISVAGSGTDITGTGLLGWINPVVIAIDGTVTNLSGAKWINGSLLETIVANITSSTNASNNFGSFGYLNNLSLNITEIGQVATWNQSQNVDYLYSIPVSVANASAYATALTAIGGCCLTLQAGGATPITTEYPEMFPMMIEAATDYTGVNTVQNYMFQQVAGLTASVTSDSDKSSYDAQRINYYGLTQDNGSQIAFYQDGLMQGTITSPPDMTTYVNEIWFKSAATAALMNLLLQVTQVPANVQGRSQVLTVLQSVINQALNNGTISVGKTLTANQKAFITNETNDPVAWQQVQSIGYWVDCVIVPQDSNPLLYEADYILIYSKDDTIRLINGIHTLI